MIQDPMHDATKQGGDTNDGDKKKDHLFKVVKGQKKHTVKNGHENLN